MTTIPALQKSIARLYSDLAEAKASIRELTARVDNKPGTSGLAGTAAAPTTIHGSLAGLGLDDHPQYMHISNVRTVSADHVYQAGTFNPASTNPPFTIGANATDQLVSGLNADQVDGQDASDFYSITTESANTVYAGPTSGGAANPSFRSLVDADLPTHDIISAHDVTGSLDQLVGLSATNTLGLLTPSDDPGAAKALLKTTSAGLLTLEDLNVTDDLNVGSGVLIANGSSNIVGINKTPTAGYDLDINTTLRTGGLATLASLSVTGAATFGDDLTVGANILFVDYSGERIGIKRAADPQFQLDILGNLRASGWIVGKHAVQLEGAVGIFHFDGREPYESDYTGVSTGHKGQKPITETAIIYRFGKFGKAIQSAVATTNLVINSSWEDGLNSWTSFGSPPTDAVVATESYYGGSSLHLVTDADDQGRYQDITITSGQIYNASVYVKIESGQIVLRSRGDVGDNYYVESDVGWAGDGEWHRMHVRFTSTGTSGQVYVGRRSGYGSSGEYYIDAIQLELYDSITPYCDGSLGSGHSFSGADHASMSSRIASIMDYSPDLAKSNRGTFMCWFKFQNDATHSPLSEYVVTITASTGYLFIGHSASSSVIRFSIGSSASNGSASADGAWHHVAITWDGTDAYLYLDGSLDITHLSYTGFSGPITDIDIGDGSTHIRQMNGWIDEIAFLDRVADADEIASIYESDAPVFAETSTFEWSTPSITTWVDEEGLWSRGAVTGQEVFGISDVNSKSWAGITMDEGDVIIGNSPNFLLWDDSNSRLIVTGKILATQGNMIGGSIFSESFQDSSAIEDWYDWQPTPAAELSIASGGVFGGNHLVVGNNSGNDMAVLAHIVNIPYDPTKTYKVTFRVRRISGTGSVYLGLMGVGADGITLVNKSGGDSYGGQHYICAINVTPGSSWTVYDGYITGNAATGSDGTPGDPTNPGTLHEDAVYIRAMGYYNYNGVAGIMDVDSITIEVVPEGDDLTSIDGGRLVNYSVDTTQLTATAIDGMTITGSVIRTSSSGARIEMNSTRIFGTDGSTTQWEALNADGKLTAGGGDTVLDENGIELKAGNVNHVKFVVRDGLSSSGYLADGDILGRFRNRMVNNPAILQNYTIIEALNATGIGGSPTYPGVLALVGEDRVHISNDVGVANPTPDGNLYTGTITVATRLGETWTSLSFGTNWSDFGSTEQVCEYKKHGDLIFLRGLATSGASAWSTYTIICTLPAGYRPAANLSFASVGSINAFIRVVIRTDGTVRWQAGGAGSGWISLDGIVFSVD